MKKRILVVDDEPMVLQEVKRSLLPMREEWDMDFAEGGEKALDFLGPGSYDVVLTDVLMPGLDGSKLLALVRERTPETIRLIHSWHAEAHLAMKWVGLAHQFLSKPCDGEVLRATISRLADRHFALRNEKVMAIICRLEDLPSIPTTYSRMVRLLEDPDVAFEQIGDLIAEDMAMTAKILQLVNSPFFGLSSRVSNPTEAATYLGLKNLKSLVLAEGVFGQFESKLPDGFSPSAAAEHSQHVAAAARVISKLEKAAPRIIDECLAAGLLHDVGKLVLASNLPDEFERLAEEAPPNMLEAEGAVFGATHAEVGGYLLGLWGLPASVVEAIRFHHTPGDSHQKEFSVLTATHIADALLHEPEGSTVNMEYLNQIGLAQRLPVWSEAIEDLSEFFCLR